MSKKRLEVVVAVAAADEICATTRTLGLLSLTLVVLV